MKYEFSLSLPHKSQKLGWIYLAFELFLLPSLLIMLGSAAGITSDAVLNCIYYIVNFIVCLLLFYPLLHHSVKNAMKQPENVLLTAGIGFILFQLANIAIGYLISAFMPDFSNVNDSAVAVLVYESPLLMLICVGFLVPVAEECLFRGLLFVPVYRRKPLAAYALSVLFFAAIHVVGYIGLYPMHILALCFIQYLPAGLVLCWALAKTDSMVTPILIHSAVNLFSILTLR